VSLADSKYMDCSCCGPNGVARGEIGALCPLCQDAGCEPFEDVCKVPPAKQLNALDAIADIVFWDGAVKKLDA
jgi:hypothetical protein